MIRVRREEGMRGAPGTQVFSVTALSDKHTVATAEKARFGSGCRSAPSTSPMPHETSLLSFLSVEQVTGSHTQGASADVEAGGRGRAPWATFEQPADTSCSILSMSQRCRPRRPLPPVCGPLS